MSSNEGIYSLPDGCTEVVAKIGMMVQAVIMPMNVVTDDLVDRLDELTRMCRSALLRKNWSETGREQVERADAADKGQDTPFPEGEDAGDGSAGPDGTENLKRL